MLVFISLVLILFISCQSKNNSNANDKNSSFPYNYQGQFTGYIKLKDSTNINDGWLYGSISEYHVDINKKILEGQIIMIYNSGRDTLVNDTLEEGYITNDTLFLKIIKISDTLTLNGPMIYEDHFEGEWILKNKILKGKGNFYFEKPQPIDTLFKNLTE